MRSLYAALICVCVLLSYTGDAFAQEMEAKKMEGHTWHELVMVKFEAGMADSAMKIIDNHFMKAGMEMESDMPAPQIMRLRSGEWDLMMVWTMDSIEDMNWEMSPEDIKWWEQMVEQEGSEEKAIKLMRTFDDMISNSTSYLATSKQQTPSETMGDNRQQ
ncbi:hypothetical protein CK503_07130 [Aliifodinibius salipaludis]|uniref:NIPSNAP domain-containing protein n=1 Tax=Fodinibius salipaludis TaxID=2032627 RepID=A0A2A2GBJ6_9BACT|nr:hypothetical protein [Aliifodinibius salipaludis]PAU94560.1 hypothetical protein CK503_07130 [Aliifodinibius salipaludis]